MSDTAVPVDTQETDDGTSRFERGATLVIAAATLIVLMGMAAFSVDLGWLYLKASETQRAAESASLAGVVYMPKPSTVSFGVSQAWTTAVDVASRNGMSSTTGASVTPKEVPGRPNQLRVEITNTVPTFFMKVFGISTVTFTRAATAEQLPPLKLGSDQPLLGSDPDRGIDNNFWVAINGEREAKENGDPFSTKCINGGCSSQNNSEYRDPAYWYGIEVPPGSTPGLLDVEIYDGSHWAGNRADASTGDTGATGDRTSQPIQIDFRVFAPDQTPSDPTDNTVIPAGCTRTFTQQPSESSPGVQVWTTVCSIPAASPGIYVLEVSVDGESRSISDYAVRTRWNGAYASPANPVAVFGLGAMSLDMVEAGTTPQFQVVKLEPIYAGTQLIIGLFDPGDIAGSPLCSPNCYAWLRFLGEASAFDCDIRVNGGAWVPDDSPGAAPCEINTINQRYNADWLELRFDVPDDYVCASDCWVRVKYDLAPGTDVNERTTWTARINGQPIHLLP